MIPFSCPRTCPAYRDRWCRFRPLTDLIGHVLVDSHVARIDTTICDLEALALAASHCGLVFRRGQRSYRWYGAWQGDFPLPEGITQEQLGRCQHAIAVPGRPDAYEIGVVARKDGSGFDLLWDFWDGGKGLQPLAGDNCSKLVGAYLHALADRAAQALGWLTEVDATGSLVVHHPEGGVLTLAKSGELVTEGFVGGGCHAAREALGLPVVEGSIVETGEACAVAARVQLPVS